MERSDPYEVRSCIHGLGLFATSPFAKGSPVLRFRGTIKTYEETRIHPERECYFVQVGVDRYVFPQPPECLINHSCEPNCGFRGADTLVALVDIAPGAELTFDYSTCMDENSWTMKCACGGRSCRGIIGDFRDLPWAWKIRYLDLGAVPSWLRERLFEGPRLLPISTTDLRQTVL